MLLLQKFITHPQLVKGTAAVWTPDSPKGYTISRDIDDFYPHVQKLVKQAHVFVISDIQTVLATMAADKLPPYSPFPICWFELVEPDEDNDLLAVFYQDQTKKMRRVFLDAPDRTVEGAYSQVAPVGALVHEISPGIYDIFAMEIVLPPKGSNERMISISSAMSDIEEAKREYDAGYAVSITIFRKVNPYSEVFNPKLPPTFDAVTSWMHAINEGVIATEDTAAPLYLPRVEKRNKLRPHEVRRIVRILPKKLYRKEIAPLTPKGVIDWSHRWEVRGHWRKVKGLGKDRAGDYCVHGHTWVKDFVKGPEDKDLVVKTRVLYDQSRTT